MLQREEALKKSEQMLEEDALRFDAFLKENDEKVQEAIKRAEVEAKAKQDKVSLHSHQPWLSTTGDQHQCIHVNACSHVSACQGISAAILSVHAAMSTSAGTCSTCSTGTVPLPAMHVRADFESNPLLIFCTVPPEGLITCLHASHTKH